MSMQLTRRLLTVEEDVATLKETLRKEAEGGEFSTANLINTLFEKLADLEQRMDAFEEQLKSKSKGARNDRGNRTASSGADG